MFQIAFGFRLALSVAVRDSSLILIYQWTSNACRKLGFRFPAHHEFNFREIAISRPVRLSKWSTVQWTNKSQLLARRETRITQCVIVSNQPAR